MEKMGSCPRSPKLTQLNLGSRSLAGLITHSQFLLLWFGMPGMPMVKPLTGLNNVLRMSVTSLVYLSSPCAKHSGKVKFLQDHFIFDHPNQEGGGVSKEIGGSVLMPV